MSVQTATLYNNFILRSHQVTWLVCRWRVSVNMHEFVKYWPNAVLSSVFKQLRYDCIIQFCTNCALTSVYVIACVRYVASACASRSCVARCSLNSVRV